MTISRIDWFSCIKMSVHVLIKDGLRCCSYCSFFALLFYLLSLLSLFSMRYGVSRVVNRSLTWITYLKCILSIFSLITTTQSDPFKTHPPKTSLQPNWWWIKPVRRPYYIPELQRTSRNPRDVTGIRNLQ